MTIFKKKPKLYEKGIKREVIKIDHSLLYPLFIELVYNLDVTKNLNTY